MDLFSRSSLQVPLGPIRSHSSPPDPERGDNENNELLVVPNETTPRTLNRSPSSFFETSTQKLRKSWGEAQASTLKLSVSMSHAVLGDDITKDLHDLKRTLVGDDSICEHCRQFRISTWLNNTDQADAKPLIWETPLERIIRLRGWCKLCRFLVHMLSQPENDPLRREKVAKHMPQELSGVALSQLVDYDWEIIDVCWPFGRTSEPGRHSSYALGKYEEDAIDMVNDYRAMGFAREAWMIGLSAVAAAAAKKQQTKNGKGTKTRSTPKPRRDRSSGRDRSPGLMGETSTLKIGREMEKASHVQYRKQCLLRISLEKGSPSFLRVECRGYTGLATSQMEILSTFRLNVAQNIASPSPLNELVIANFSYNHKVDPHWIDLSRTKQWLWECETKHGIRCSVHGWDIARETPYFLRVIDVHRECLVTPPDPARCRYVALSYMWGGFNGARLTSRNIPVLSRDGGLRMYKKDIPKTILDAMEVVKGMGERYLWVDVLCKLQGSDSDTVEIKERVRHETMQMDRIYGGALVTLVAASGTHADAGLQGVKRDGESTERSIHQESAEIDGHTLVAPLSGGQDLEKTPWNRRGWTFQERLLSRRIIAFANDEMVWYCHCATCREDSATDEVDVGNKVPESSLQTLTLEPSWFSGNGHGVGKTKTVWNDGSLETDRFGMTHLVRSGRLSEYIKAVEQYTHRQLTYRGDILNAFAGLSSIFERSFEARSLFGLLESVLDMAILWRPDRPLRRRDCRREQFPSWSWAGWEGPVYYDKPITIHRRDGDGVITSYTTSGRSHGGEEGIRPLLRWHTWNTKKQCFEPINGNRGRGFPVPKGGFPKEWESNAFGGNRHPRQLLPEGTVDLGVLRSHHLMFSTSCCKSFRLGPTMMKSAADNETPPVRHVVLSGDGRPAGAVTLDSAKLEADASGLGVQSGSEFIIIAETHHLSKNGQVGEFADYLVMLVAKQGGSGIYERLGLGHISKARWLEGESEVKTVILG